MNLVLRNKSNEFWMLIIVTPVLIILLGIYAWLGGKKGQLRSKVSATIHLVGRVRNALQEHRDKYGILPKTLSAIETEDLKAVDPFNQEGELRSTSVEFGRSERATVTGSMLGYMRLSETRGIVFSIGPDLRQDLTFHNCEDENLQPRTYDPTRGLASPGDIFRIVH
jgi:hypothetical protein